MLKYFSSVEETLLRLTGSSHNISNINIFLRKNLW